MKKLLTCQIPDEALLALAHRDLGLWQSLRVRFHLGRCRTCRRRYEDYAAISRGFARRLMPAHNLGKSAFAAAADSNLSFRNVRRFVMISVIAAIMAVVAAWTLSPSMQVVERISSSGTGSTGPERCDDSHGSGPRPNIEMNLNKPAAARTHPRPPKNSVQECR